MTNEEAAKKLADANRCIGLTCEQCRYRVAIEMAEWKDKQIKNHEQSLLWIVESILDKIVPDEESYNIAINEFKRQLINEL